MWTPETPMTPERLAKLKWLVGQEVFEGTTLDVVRDLIAEVERAQKVEGWQRKEIDRLRGLCPW